MVMPAASANVAHSLLAATFAPAGSDPLLVSWGVRVLASVQDQTPVSAASQRCGGAPARAGRMSSILPGGEGQDEGKNTCSCWVSEA